MRVVGFHFIFTAYGFWLPNDPRGSWSSCIRQLDLLQHGQATKIETTQSVAHTQHDRHARQQAKQAMKYPPVRFTGEQARAIGRGIATAANEYEYIIHALCILPDHVHLVMAWHPRKIDLIASHMKAKATRAMRDEGIHPMTAYTEDGRTPSPWARKYWCPFIKDAVHMRMAIRYVKQNPVKAGLRKQRWRCVTPYEG